MRTIRHSAVLVAVVALAVVPVAAVGAASTAKPSVISFKVTPTSLMATGGSVTLIASVKNATSCTFSVTPSVKGLPATVPCASNKASKKVTLPKNLSAAATSYAFSLKASGPGGSTTAKPVRAKVLAAPSISSFTSTPKMLTPTGGSVTLIASVKNATSCTFSVTPSVKGLPTTVGCSSNRVAKKINLPENATASTLTYSFSLKASGAGGLTTAAPQHLAVLPFWSAPQSIDRSGQFASVSCPSSSFCEAVDSSGNVLSWNGKSWSLPQTIDNNGGLLGIGLASVSCAPRSTTFCVAVDGGGKVLIWNGKSWSAPTSLENGSRLDSVSCPTTRFCAVVDASGRVAMLTGTSWAASQSIDPGVALASVSCPSSSFCVAVDAKFSALTWNGKSWSAPHSIDRGGLASVSCPSSSYCMALDRHGNFETWNGKSWSAPSPRSIDPEGSAQSVSCPNSSFCEVIDTWGYVITWNGKSWSAPVAIGVDPESISCPTASFCAAVGDAGDAIIGKS
jgi:hypothetical protein